ncbi:MAG: methyltransferase domain-containing protein [Pseudomonadota bacterium]
MTNTMDTKPERYRKLDNVQKYDTKIKTKGVRSISHILELSALKRALANIHGNSVLDAPCGTGRIDLLLRERFTKVVGLDSSESMLAVYRSKEHIRTGLLGDIFRLPFKNDSFDWVVCHRLFHHFNTDELRLSLLKSIAQTARDGVVFYSWVKTPLAHRESSRRVTVNLNHIIKLISEAGLTLESVHHAFWPFQPKAILVCRKRS